MKRYKCNFLLNLDPKGEWVRYNDVKLIIETKPPEITIVSIECNCAREAINPTGFNNYYDRWICPAHGYKSL